VFTHVSLYLVQKNHHQLYLEFVGLVVSTLNSVNIAYKVESIQKEIKVYYKFKFVYYKA
jgi:hypothetical protein